MKKTVLSIVLASTLLLTACSTSNAKKESETTTTAAETTTTTEATTTTEETTTAPAENVIIPLFKSSLTVEDIKKIKPEDLSNFKKFTTEYFPVSASSGKYYKFDDHESFTICSSNNKDNKIDITLFFFECSGDVANTAKFSGGDGTLKSQIPFIPLFYNQTKGCLVGYRDAMINAHKFTFVEKYIDQMVDADPSEYGL